MDPLITTQEYDRISARLHVRSGRSRGAEIIAQRLTPVIPTGMGGDGAKGLLPMKQASAYTIARDETSCVVFGMPKEAIKLGGVDTVVSLEPIASTVLTHMSPHS